MNVGRSDDLHGKDKALAKADAALELGVDLGLGGRVKDGPAPDLVVLLGRDHVGVADGSELELESELERKSARELVSGKQLVKRFRWWYWRSATNEAESVHGGLKDGAAAAVHGDIRYNNTTIMGDTGAAAFDGGATSGVDKGKGKAVDNHPADDVSMGEDEESSSDESTVEDVPVEDDEDEEDTAQDNLEPISAENIISGGRRTRGKMIDFAEAAKKAQEAGDPIDEDEDDDDGDFELQDDATNNQDEDHMMRD
ncbi:hypothetical protein ACJ73_06994 [Blastomyces percursus]|uniref:Histone chaperone domain-containing protein n=1 Tax=Blastomyces percursus TaxID=1658174 RepID=A0A1J9PZC3_9EURO|nr:hypothetical protein ACJ73_06994 [Blastomyces percursus]